jgi:hypothetical protein
VVAQAHALLEEISEPIPAPKPRGKRPFRTIKKVANQQGLKEGQVRYWCSACMKSFVVEDGQEPEACPEGHRAEDPEPTA